MTKACCVLKPWSTERSPPSIRCSVVIAEASRASLINSSVFLLDVSLFVSDIEALVGALSPPERAASGGLHEMQWRYERSESRVLESHRRPRGLPSFV